jgi:hypothetical protein
MRRVYPTLAVAVGLGIVLASASLATAQAVPGSARAPASSGGSWGKAIEVPGLGRLNAGNYADLGVVSCTAPGDCSAGGFYWDVNSHQQGLVVTERNGSWGKAMEVPGLGRLNAGENAEVDSLSCAGAGDCSAGGQYTDSKRKVEAFVANERDGVWGEAIEVPGSARLNVRGEADIGTMSCTKPGDCTAGGEYGVKGPLSGAEQPMVVTERNGVWGKAIEVPGAARLNVTAEGQLDSVSCAKPGDCAAGGYYFGAEGYEAFVVTQRNGRWGTAIEVPGSGALNYAGDATVTSVSCAAPGDCSAGGSYEDSQGNHQALVVTESNGRWGDAIEVPGTAYLNAGGQAEVESVSCAKPGYCGAGGYYTAMNVNVSQAFVVTERRGRWATGLDVPGSRRLNTGGQAGVNSVSCAAPGDCSAGGFYQGANMQTQAFVLAETGGSWEKAIELPGSAHLNVGGYAEVNSVSCTAPGRCSAVGDYENAVQVFSQQALVATQR